MPVDDVAAAKATMVVMSHFVPLLHVFGSATSGMRVSCPRRPRRSDRGIFCGSGLTIAGASEGGASLDSASMRCSFSGLRGAESETWGASLPGTLDRLVCCNWAFTPPLCSAFSSSGAILPLAEAVIDDETGSRVCL